MAIKTYRNTDFAEVTAVKVHNGTDFSDVSAVNVYTGGAWKKVFPTSQTLTKTYSLSSAEIYWGTGGKEKSYPAQLIVGSYNSSRATARRTLMFFPLTTIMKDLNGTSIVSAELYLKRLNTAHGEAKCSTLIKTHSFTSAPARWEDGADTGNADSGTPVFARGEGKWVPLLVSVGEGLRDGTVKGICLDADSNYSLSRYARFERASAKLRIKYIKEG